MEDKDKNKKKPLHNDSDHPLKSRRDFLSQGLLASAASMLLPFNAFAESECEIASVTAVENPMLPVIIIDLAGGANIGGSNVIVGGQAGQSQFLPNVSDYRSLGLTPDQYPSLAGRISDITGNTTNPSGLLFHAQSGLLQGIMNTAPAQARSRTDGIILCGISADDTSNNPHNPMYWFHKAGARGQLTQLVGTRNSQSGGNSQAPATSIDLSVAPLRITNTNDVTDLASLGFHSQNNRFASGKESILLRAIEGLSSSKVRALSRRGLPDAVKDLVLCNINKTQALLNRYTPAQLNPSADTAVTTAFPALNNDNIQREAGSIAKMVLDGFAAAGTITLGGYDYHGNTRVVTDQRDVNAGEIIGRVMHLAHLKNTPVVIYVMTDGGVASNASVDPANGKFQWSSDSGNRASSLMLVYDPAGKPEMTTQSRQMGHYRVGGSVQPDASPMSNSVTTLAKAVMLNYLALHGKEGDLASIVGDNPFQNSMDQHLFFRRIA